MGYAGGKCIKRFAEEMRSNFNYILKYLYFVNSIFPIEVPQFNIHTLKPNHKIETIAESEHDQILNHQI